MARFSFSLILLTLIACSSGDGRPRRGGGDGGAGPDGSGSLDAAGGDFGTCVPSLENTPAACGDAIDNDCDGSFDCTDLDCSGVGSCPVCGQVDTPLSAPLALPDGVGGNDCTTDANCPGDQHCFTITGAFGGDTMECRESYRSTLSFTGFGPRRFEGVGDIQSLCVEMEHSFLRDLEITLEAPSGQRIRLQRFLGQEGGEIYLGQADDCDSGDSPSPGTGARYCWTPGSARPSMLEYANNMGMLNQAPDCSSGTADSMPPGEYSSAEDWTGLIGTPLNGDWTLSVTDLWPLDNGYIFEWSINFDPRTVEDCSIPLI